MDKTFCHDFMLTAADCNSQRELSMANLINYIIETATGHANRLGVGFDHMISMGLSWVLSRVSVELAETTCIGHSYRLLTWVSSINRMFSERCFELIDITEGRTVGYARTIWMAINMETRATGDLSSLEPLREAVNDRRCPIAPMGKFLPPELPENAPAYTFAVSDIDVNCHVTTRRYVELVIDCQPLEVYDRNRIERFDIAFRQEARYGETARYFGATAAEEGVVTARIDTPDRSCAFARLKFVPRA